MITVSVNSVIGSGGSNGHDDHNTTRTNKTNPTTNGITPGSGPFDTTFTYPSNQKWWGDIIPPFTYAGGFYSGLNWGPDWTTPNPSGGTSDWLEPSEFAAAVSATASVYRNAVLECMDLSGTPGAQTAKSAAVDTPQKYFDVAIQNGEDSDSAREDLVEQDALSMGNPPAGGGSGTSVPSVSTLETTYSATAPVATDPATSAATTSATLNGVLKSGRTWTTWKYQWATSQSAITAGTGSSYTYTPGTDPASSVGAGATNPAHVASGLSCGTTYYFRVVGTDNSSNTAYGLLKTFTTSACGGGGGGSGGGGTSDGGGSSGGSGGSSSSGGGSTNGGGGSAGGGGGNRPPATVGPNTRPGNTTGGTTVAAGNGRVTVNPSQVLSPPPGTTWRPNSTRLVDPQTRQPVNAVTTSQGSWTINPANGAVSFRPAPSYTGNVRMRVALTGRNGQLYIRSMDFRVNAKARVLVLSGDVPGTIDGGRK